MAPRPDIYGQHEFLPCQPTTSSGRDQIPDNRRTCPVKIKLIYLFKNVLYEIVECKWKAMELFVESNSFTKNSLALIEIGMNNSILNLCKTINILPRHTHNL